MDRLSEIRARCERAQREDYPERIYGCAAYYCVYEDIPYLLARAEKAEAENRWIPVGEMLPTVSEYRNGDRFKSMDSNELVPFLVCCEDTEIPFRAFYDGKNWGDGWGKQNVTHWRALPQPPQKGE